MAEVKLMKRGDASDGQAGRANRPGYLHLEAHQPSARLGDTLILDTLLDQMQDAVYFKDAASRFILNNRAHIAHFGRKSQEELVGLSDADLYPKACAEACRQDEVQVMKTGRPLLDRVEQAVNAQGEAITYSTCKYPLYGSDGQIVGTWGISHDITKLVKAEEEVARANAKLRALSLVDELSGLYNRRHFDHLLKITMDLFARKRLGRCKADFCLVLLDVDHFKKINDKYGHVTGDAVIRYVGSQMTAHTRSSDTAFRYGGDEFALILQDTDLPAGREIGERLRRHFEQNPLMLNGSEVPLTVSLGLVSYQDEKTASELVLKADRELYQAKSEGRNRLCG